MICRFFPFSKGAFSGSMLNFGGVGVLYILGWNPSLRSSDHQDVRSHQEGLDMLDLLLLLATEQEKIQQHPGMACLAELHWPTTTIHSHSAIHLKH